MPLCWGLAEARGERQQIQPRELLEARRQIDLALFCYRYIYNSVAAREGKHGGWCWRPYKAKWSGAQWLLGVWWKQDP